MFWGENLSEYKIPNEYYFRIHHVRPRFKSDVESVLIYMAEELTRIGERPKDEFIREANVAIKRYPGNARCKDKTINNWRTEISSLFGFIGHTDDTCFPSRRAIELTDKHDLVEAFKLFLYTFQYPGAFLKPQHILKQIEAGVRFKPAQYILRLLRYANNENGNSKGLTKAEACHCVFNDLRVIRDNESVDATWNRIAANRKNSVEYDCTGDIVRYAGDIIDYMEIANLLKTYDSRTYYLNRSEEEAIVKFCESDEWFECYDNMITRRSGTLDAVNGCSDAWFEYVNRGVQDTDFSTDILSYIVGDGDSVTLITDSLDNGERDISERIEFSLDSVSTKDIGDMGEGLVHAHECMRLKLGDCEDLIHLVQRIPNKFAMGYDINSVNVDASKRYIEVKTTISSKPLKFTKVHLTPNEWNAADSLEDKYFIYRLSISKGERKLLLLQNPVGLYKDRKIRMALTNNGGADIMFNPDEVGTYEELLSWQS